MFRSSLVVLCALAVPARAAIYESPISIEDDDDLRSMGERGDISDATLQTLLELYEDGVDLNTANREELYELPGLNYADVDAIIAYRKAQGHIDDPSVLVGADAITADQLLQIAPFILITDPEVKIPLGGKYRLMGAYTVGDQVAPPAFATLDMKGPFSLSGGIGLTFTRRRVGNPSYDSIRDAISVAPQGYSLEVPKFYLQWKGSKLRVIAGTFRIGFAQRLTLDNTTRYTPNGITPDNVFYVNRELSGSCRYSAGELPASPCSDTAPDYVTDDFKWRDPFRGVALAAEGLEIGEQAKVSLYAFGSFQTRSIYQYELYNRRICDDPRNDADSSCGSPQVYVRPPGTDPFADQARLSFSTLPQVVDELAFGGHAELSPAPMFAVGLTGYGAVPFFHLGPQMQLDFQEYSKYPFGGPWGAVGIDGRLTLSDWNLYLELARSFDQEPGGGGGWGVVQRSVWGKKKRELEITARFYDVRYVNPYARPVSSPDELDGQRARNEAGLRVKFTERSLGDFQLRALADFWVLPWDAKELEGTITGNNGGFKAGTMNLQGELRADYKGWRLFQPAVYVRYANRDLAHSGLGACYSSSDGRAPPTIEGEPVLCTGERYVGGVRIDFTPLGRKLDFMLTYQHSLVSDTFYKDKLAQDVRATFEVRSQPVDWLLIRARARYTNYDIESNTRLEDSLWSFLEVTYLGLKVFHATVRYDAFVWLDKRDSTLTRNPNPEHRLRLELKGRF